MSQAFAAHPFRTEARKKFFRSLSLICEDESLSDVQLKAYQTRLQEYRTFLEAVSRLALCGNVCITEEAVTIGEHGLLTGESLNALQHAGAISVYNTLQQNNWEFPISEEGEVAIVKAHIPVPDEFLDSEKPIRSDWPAVHISECFVEGERAKLHGSVRPLRTFLPPTIVFRNAADVDEDAPEPEVNMPNSGPDGGVEIVSCSGLLSVKKPNKEGKDPDYIPIDEYYFGRQDGQADYLEEKGDFRFKCAVCQRMFYSNVKLMSHILGHVDETSQACLESADYTQCTQCEQQFASAFELRDHIDRDHGGIILDPKLVPPGSTINTKSDQLVAQTASQLLMQQQQQQRACDAFGQLQTSMDETDFLATTNPMPTEQTSLVTGVMCCRICAKTVPSELALAHHLQSTHRQREMPYVCRLCLFRSSMFEDILDHFKKVHDNSNHLLCTYCLRIFTPSDARVPNSPTYGGNAASTAALGMGVGQTQVYLQHLRMHQVRHQLRRCPSCRLNFTNKSDYQIHRRLDHKATRGGASDKQELHMDSYEAELYNLTSEQSMLEGPDPVDQTSQSRTDLVSKKQLQTERVQNALSSLKRARPNVMSMNAPEAGRAHDLGINFWPDHISQLECLECGDYFGTEAHNHYLPCSLCRFATCCSVGFDRHIRHSHTHQHSIPTNTSCGAPMVRPITFGWVEDTVDLDKDAPVLRPGTQSSEPITTTTTTTTTATVLGTLEQPISENVSIVQLVDSEGRTMDELLAESVESFQHPNANAPTTESSSTEPAPTDSTTEPALVEAAASDASIPSAEVAPTKSEPTSMVSMDPIVQYMSHVVDARLFYCSHCAANNMDGNGLASHLVEECGTSMATLNPDPALLVARSEAEARKLSEQLAKEYEQQQQQLHQQQQQQQQEANVIFQSGDMPMTLAGEMHPGVLTSGEGDVVMLSVDPDQLSSMGGLITTDDQGMLMGAGAGGATQIVAQMGPNGTTIDVTDAGGEIVQQFILPEDLQLEEGQTLVMIHGEDGQPQLAIVNQADLIGGDGSQLVLQTEDDQTNGMLLYNEALESQQQQQLPEGVVLQREDEKENNQFIM